MKQLLGFVLFALFAVNLWAGFDIRLPDSPTPAEHNAADELRNYLAKTTGNIIIDGKKTMIFHIGDTAFARNHDINCAKMDSESWRVKSIDGEVVLAGGGTRGTLYAVYNFIENRLGVHWWTRWDSDYIPPLKDLRLERLDDAGKPFFTMREVYRYEPIFDNGRFSARNRSNCETEYAFGLEFGGRYCYGSPYHVHTYGLYLPPRQYFKEHPDYYSMRKDGTRDNSQLCISNPEVRRLLLEKLKQNIVKDEAKAKQNGVPAPSVYDFSINDNWHQCYCRECLAVAQGDNLSGLHLRLLNELADEVKKIRPDIVLEMLAYYYTEEPPLQTRPRDNVVIRLCDTRSNQVFGPSHPDNVLFRKLVERWGKLGNVYIWDYTFTDFSAQWLPFPSEYHYAETHRFYAENGVKGIFWQGDCPVLGDMYALKNWLQIKLMENPSADFKQLHQTFMNQYYGKAGELLSRYREKLLQAANRHRLSFLVYDCGSGAFQYIDLDTMLECQKLCDQALLAVADDPELSRRVRHARFSIDYQLAAVNTFFYFGEWQRHGGKTTDFPVDLKAIRQSLFATWREIGHLNNYDDEKFKNSRAKGYWHNGEIINRNIAFQQALESKGYAPPPGYEKRRYLEFLAPNYRWATPQNLSLVNDPESVLGQVMRIDTTDSKPMGFPVPMAFHGFTHNGVHPGVSIDRSNVPSQGYNWYRIGPVNLVDHGYLYLTRSWGLQIGMGPFNQAFGGKPVIIMARIKFEGPLYFPHQTGKANSVLVERIIVIEATDKDIAESANRSGWFCSGSGKKSNGDDGEVIVDGSLLLVGDALTRIEKDKKYRISGKFKQADGLAPANFNLGAVMLTEPGWQEIQARNVKIMPESLTTIRENVKANARTVKIGKLKKAPQKGYFLAFAATASLGDLPNFNTCEIMDVVIGEDGYDLTLKNGPDKDYELNSIVRLHAPGGYLYASGGNAANSWQTFEGVVGGEASSGNPANAWWKGTAYAKPLVLVHGKSGQGVMFKNVMIEEIK